MVEKNEGGRATFRPRLQPKLPGRRKEKTEPGKPEKKEPRNWKVVYGIAAVAVVVVVLAVIVMVYSPPPPRAGNALSDSQVRAELARVREISAHLVNVNPRDYPKVLGIYAGNNLTLVEQYFCSDVCPDNGRVDLVFLGIGPDKCESVGGRELRDLAWGGYIGCGPRVE